MTTIYLSYNENYRQMNDRECLAFPQLLAALIPDMVDDQHVNVGNSLAIDAVRAAICEDKLPYDQIALWYEGKLVWFDEDGRTLGDLPEPHMPLLCTLVDGNERMNQKRREQQAAIEAERAPKFKKIQEALQWGAMMRYNG